MKSFKVLMGAVLISGAAMSAPLSASAASGVPAAGVYVNSDGSPLLPLLQNARSTIDIEIYTMADQTVRDLIRQALSRGVKVRILKDPNPLGDKCSLFGTSGESTDTKPTTECADEQKLVSEVRAAGGTYDPFDKSALCPNGGGKSGSGCYEHGKIALVDGIAMISTGNFDDTNLCIDGTSKCNRDYTLILDDTSVYSTLEDIFEADLKASKYDVESLIPSQLKDTLTVSPDSLTPIVDFISSATESIDLEAQYLEDPQLNAALEAAARKGVKVSVTVASACAFGKPSASDQNKITATYGDFDREGISSAFFNASNRINGKEGYMHAKVIVVDGSRAWLGSENGSAESLTENREYGYIFDNADWVKTILDTVRADHDSADSETWSESLACAKDSGKKTGGSATAPAPVSSGGTHSLPPPKPKKPVKPTPTKPKKPTKPKP